MSHCFFQAWLISTSYLKTSCCMVQDAYALTPKGLNVRGVTKPVLGSVTWSHTIFRFFETFCEDASRHKHRMSTNFIIFGPTDQKLWMFEAFRRSPGNQKTFYFSTFLGWSFFHRFLTKFLIISSTWKRPKTHGIY
jgi:hypothetical protein